MNVSLLTMEINCWWSSVQVPIVKYAFPIYVHKREFTLYLPTEQREFILHLSRHSMLFLTSDWYLRMCPAVYCWFLIYFVDKECAYNNPNIATRYLDTRNSMVNAQNVIYELFTDFYCSVAVEFFFNNWILK